MATHYYKTWPEYFVDVSARRKPFELRRDDRGAEVEDVFVLQEWDPETETYTGEEEVRLVTYVLRDAEQFGLMPGFAIFGFGEPG